MTYDQWFRSQQGISYEGSYLFAEAAWDHQQKRINELEAELTRVTHNLATTEQTMLEYQELAAKRLEEIAKYRDAPVVWIHSGHLHQALNQSFLCRVLPEQCEGYKQLIVKPGEEK